MWEVTPHKNHNMTSYNKLIELMRHILLDLP
jgi:hypothetical protein